MDYIIVTQNGVSHDFVDQSNNIQKLIDNNDMCTLHFPSGYYRIDKPIRLKSNVNLVGDNATFVVLGDKAFYGSMYEEEEYVQPGVIPNKLSNIKISGFKFNIDQLKPSIYLRCIENVSIDNISTSGGGIWINNVFKVNSNDGTLNPSETAGIVSLDYCNNNIHISNVTVENENWGITPTHPDSQFCRGISIEYGNDIRISDCYIYGMSQGIMLWGGDAEPNKGGSTASRLYSNNVTITNCIVKNCTGGGIWGSMVNNMVVSNCIVDHTIDVGIDFESCWNSIANGNVVKNCRAGNLSVFSCCKNIIFSNNISLFDTDEYLNTINKPYNTHFALSNSANTSFDMDIVLDGCSFITKNNNIGEVTWGTCRNRIVRNCTFENTILCYNHGTLGHVNSEISNNKFYFSKPCTNLTAISVETNRREGFHDVNGNSIHFNGTNGICTGIECRGVNGEGDFLIQNNYIMNMRYGIDNSIKCKQTGTDKLYAMCKNNIINTKIVTEGSVSLIKDGNISIGGTKFD